MTEYRDGRNTSLAYSAIPTVLTAPVLLLFSVDPVTALLEGAMLWTCALVFVAAVHGAYAAASLRVAMRRQRESSAAAADGRIHGWIIGVAANGYLFLVCALFFEVWRAIAEAR